MRVRCERTNRPESKPTGPAGNRREADGGRQLVQLVICVVLFLTVFIGKGAFPERVAQVGPQLLGVVRRNTDFRAAFAELGGTIANEESLPEGVREFCVTVFGVDAQEETEPPLAQAEPVEVMKPEPLPQEVPEPEEPVAPEPAQPEYKVGDVVETIAVEGDSLPAGYSGNHLYLGNMETATPVKGRLTSSFGYRMHPTLGRYAVHGGVDIGAASGTEIHAFADGTVEFVGENDDFGLYFQLKHENGVETFYSHCKSIAVQKGEKVQVGQTVARVGSTGQSTGPHLHFEVRLDDVRLNPEHYIDL